MASQMKLLYLRVINQKWLIKQLKCVLGNPRMCVLNAHVFQNNVCSDFEKHVFAFVQYKKYVLVYCVNVR